VGRLIFKIELFSFGENSLPRAMVRVKEKNSYTRTNRHARKIARKNMSDNLGVLKRKNAGMEKRKNPPITHSSLATAEIVKKKNPPTHPVVQK
jgi:hypothetical protein